MIPKYIVRYNGVSYPYYSIEEAAVSLLGFKVEKSKDGRNWDIIVNGVQRAHYITDIADKFNGYTKDEAIKDYMRDFTRNNSWCNLQWYKLCE